MNCVKCGKEMTDPSTSTSIIGVHIEWVSPEGYSLQQWAQKQMGKYELNKPYRFCYECWLDSLFGVIENL